jgi:hypothetical protein
MGNCDLKGIYLQRKLKWKVNAKVIKMPSCIAWVQRPSGPLKSGGKCKQF